MMIKRTRLLAVAFALNITAITIPGHAALVTHIDDLYINGTQYDVTFHAGPSFVDLWDGNGDGSFGADGSLFDVAPTFWGDKSSAFAARNAIINFLGDTDLTYLDGAAFSDSFFVPYAAARSDFITVALDGNVRADVDTYGYLDFYHDSYDEFLPFASFVETVPIPAAVWLFGSGLLGLIGLARSKPCSCIN